MSGHRIIFFLYLLFGLPLLASAQVALHGLFTPVNLQADTTVIYLRDYLPDLDYSEISLPDGLLDHSPKRDTLMLTGDMPAKMGRLDLLTPDGIQSLVLVANDQKKVTIRIAEESIEGEEVRVFGSFNNWNREVTPLIPDQGFYQASYQLVPGRYEYKLLVDGMEITDPDNPETVDNGMGSANSVLRVPEPAGEKPSDFQLRRVPEKDEQLILTNNANRYLAFWNNQPIVVACEKSIDGNCRLRIPPVAQTMKRSYVRIYSYRGKHRGKDLLLPLEYGEPVSDIEQLNRTDWHQARMYFLMIDRFNNADTANDLPTPDPEIQPLANYLGGDLAGVSEKVNQNFFDSLGMNTIWISPITQGPLDAWGFWDKGQVKSKFSAYHGYWPVSNIKVDFRFGTENDLHALLDEAHAGGKNMILDYVANHVHLNHPVYQKNPEWATSLYLEDGTKNTEKWDEQRLTTWFDDHLPTLDLRRMEVVDPMVDSAVFWLKEYSFDGFRHDATKHIDELYWRTLTYRIKKLTDKPIYQIGETYGSPQLINSYISTGMLDGQFDFNLYDASVAAFASQDGNLANLAEKLQMGLNTYGYHHLMGNITGNQDRARFISLSSGEVKFDEDAKLAGWDREIGKPNPQAYERLALLHAFNISVPGIPCVYYGDEFGLPGAGDPDNRRMMKFKNYDEDEAALLEQVKRLYHMRGSQLPLIYGSTEVKVIDERLLRIRRRYLQDEIMVLINNSDKKQPIELSENWYLLEAGVNKTEANELSAGEKLRLAPRSYVFLINKNPGK